MSTGKLSFSVASILGSVSGPRKTSTLGSNPRHFSASSTDSLDESLYAASESRPQEGSQSVASYPTPGIPFTMKDFSLGKNTLETQNSNE